MADVPAFGPGIVVGGVRHVIKPIVEEISYVDANTAKLQRLKEEEEREAQRRAQLDYANHMRSMHSRKRQRCDEVFEEEELPQLNDDEDDDLEAVDTSKRARSFERASDSNWYVESTADGSKPAPIPVMYSKQKELESLREFSPPDEEQKTCFACRYMESGAHASIYAADWNKVVQFFQATLPTSMNLRDLGCELYDFFDKTVGESLRSQHAIAEDATVWSPYGILNHFLNHNRDPTVQLQRDFWAYTEIQSVIINNEMFQFDPLSGRHLTSEAAIKKLKIIADLRDRTMRTNPHRLPFSSQEVNPASASKEVSVKFAHPYSQMRQRTNLAVPHGRWRG